MKLIRKLLKKFPDQQQIRLLNCKRPQSKILNTVTLIKYFIQKKGEYKNIKIAATKTEDNSTKTVDTKYEDKTTKMDAIRIILCPESPQTDQNNC